MIPAVGGINTQQRQSIGSIEDQISYRCPQSMQALMWKGHCHEVSVSGDVD